MTDITACIAFSYCVNKLKEQCRTKTCKSQNYGKTILSIILCKMHFGELIINRFLVIISTVWFGLLFCFVSFILI